MQELRESLSSDEYVRWTRYYMVQGMQRQLAEQQASSRMKGR